MVRSPIVFGLVALFAFSSTVSFAKTEVELQFTALQYSLYATKADLDNVTQKVNSRETTTLEPLYKLSLYADKYWADFNLDTGDQAKSGSIKAGLEISPRMYVGAILSYQQIEAETETKLTGVANGNSTAKSADNSLGIGPIIHYRSKTAASMLLMDAGVMHVDGKRKSSTASVETTTVYKMMVLAAGGDYFFKVADRIYAGAGGSYAMALSGDYSQDSGSSSMDGDYDYSVVKLRLAQLVVEF